MQYKQRQASKTEVVRVSGPGPILISTTSASALPESRADGTVVSESSLSDQKRANWTCPGKRLPSCIVFPASSGTLQVHQSSHRVKHLLDSRLRLGQRKPQTSEMKIPRKKDVSENRLDFHRAESLPNCPTRLGRGERTRHKALSSMPRVQMRISTNITWISLAGAAFSRNSERRGRGRAWFPGENFCSG